MVGLSEQPAGTLVDGGDRLFIKGGVGKSRDCKVMDDVVTHCREIDRPTKSEESATTAGNKRRSAKN